MFSLIIPQFFSIFSRTLVLWVGCSPNQGGPGYTPENNPHEVPLWATPFENPTPVEDWRFSHVGVSILKMDHVIQKLSLKFIYFEVHFARGCRDSTRNYSKSHFFLVTISVYMCIFSFPLPSWNQLAYLRAWFWTF